MVRSRKILNRVSDRRHSCLTLTVRNVTGPLSHVAIHQNCTCSLVELLNGANKICTDIVLSRVAHKAACHTLLKALL